MYRVFLSCCCRAVDVGALGKEFQLLGMLASRESIVSRPPPSCFVVRWSVECAHIEVGMFQRKEVGKRPTSSAHRAGNVSIKASYAGRIGHSQQRSTPTLQNQAI